MVKSFPDRVDACQRLSVKSLKDFIALVKSLHAYLPPEEQNGF
jgi:hypothetical protein